MAKKNDDTPPPHTHSYAQMSHTYQKQVGSRTETSPATGRKVSFPVYRTIVVWVCACGSGGTKETS
jgi:hypothetical protein